MKIAKLALLAHLGLLLSCGAAEEQGTDNKVKSTEQEQSMQNTPIFNEQQAYDYIAQQIAFGPRIPNSKAQADCANFLEEELRRHTDTVYRQETQIKAKDGTNLRCINLVGSINPNAQRRLLLLAHWDSRPWADQEDASQPVLGANDGASGVAVLLSLAEAIKSNGLNAELGIDILLTDVEDYGKTEWGDDSYALGAQYWARNPHVPQYKAFGGILLDMVGARNARFPLEGVSAYYAPSLQQAVWAAASKAGFSSYFVFEEGGSITDDHVYINQIAGIPTIDIIDLPRNSATGFVNHWHTTKDDMSNIDKHTLKAVGQTLLQYIYSL